MNEGHHFSQIIQVVFHHGIDFSFVSFVSKK